MTITMSAGGYLFLPSIERYWAEAYAVSLLPLLLLTTAPCHIAWAGRGQAILCAAQPDILPVHASQAGVIHFGAIPTAR